MFNDHKLERELLLVLLGPGSRPRMEAGSLQCRCTDTFSYVEASSWLLVRWVWKCRRSPLNVGGWWILETLSGRHWGPLAHWRAAYHPEGTAATKGHNGGRFESGEHHRHPQPNPPAPYICAGLISKARPPLFPKILPPPHHAPPLFFSLSVILQQQKGQAFVVAHSVTQTQDLRLPVVKWKLSLRLSLCSLCSCRLEERGGNSYFSTWKGSRRGHEGRLFTSDTIDFESRRFSESSRECLPGCWHHVLIEFDCQQVSKGSKQAVFHKINLLWKLSSGFLLQKTRDKHKKKVKRLSHAAAVNLITANI